MFSGSKGLSIRRLHLDMIHDDQQPEQPVMMLRLFLGYRPEKVSSAEVTTTAASVEGEEGQSSTPGPTDADIQLLCKDIKRLKWVDNNAIHLANKWKWSGLSFAQAEIIDAYASCVHGPLMKKNKYAFSLSGIEQLLNEVRFTLLHNCLTILPSS